MHALRFLSRLVALGLLSLCCVPLHGQTLDSPLTVPVGIEAKYLPQSTLTASIYATLGTPTYLEASVTGSTAWQSVNRVDFDLKPGKEYLLETYQDQVAEVKWAFIVPSGYRLLVDDVDRLLEHDVSGMDRVYRLRVVPAGSEARGLLGEAGSLRPVRVLWHVSMGYLRNAQGAGAIELREPSVAAAASVASLYYEFPSAEVDVRLATGGTLRQVLAPDGLADVQNLGSYYEIRFYRKEQVGALNNGVYQLTGSAFITYRVETPATDVLRITLFRGARTEITEMSKTNSTTWTVQDWTQSGFTSERTVEYAYPSAGVEEITVKNGSTTATRIRKEYATIGGASELVTSILGYGAANLTTAYTYYDNVGSPGSHRKLATITQPDGNWTKFTYYETPFETRGQVHRVFTPYLDAPTSAVTATTSNCRVVERLYESDWTGKNRRPFSISTTINGIVAGQIDIDYTDSTVNSRPLVTETRTRYEKSPGSSTAAETTVTKYYREDAAADTFQYWPGRVHSVTFPDGTRESRSYREGWFNPTTRSFAHIPGDYHIEELVVRGSGNSSAGSAYSLSGYTMEPVYVVASQSTMEQVIRTRQGAVVYRSTWVHNGSAWVQAQGVLSAVEDRKPLYHYLDNGRYLDEFTYTDGRLTLQKDADGVPVSLSYDRHGRVASSTKSSLGAYSTYPARPAVTASFTYDADHRMLTRSRGPASAITETWAFDTAGRLTTHGDPDSGTRTVSYPSAREVTTTLPGDVAGGGSRTVTEETYRDGRLKRRSGTASVPQYYHYEINTSSGFELRQTKPTATSGDRWQNTWLDWIGRTTQVFAPTYLEPSDSASIAIVDTYYDAYGRPQRTRHWSSRSGWGYSSPLSPDRIQTYGTMGEVVSEGLDVNGDGSLTAASNDRLTKQERRFEVHSSQTWFVERAKVLPTLNSTTERTASEVRTRLTGLSATEVSQTVRLDAAGRSETETITVDRTNRLRTATVAVAGVSTNATTVWLNGLFHGSTTASGAVVTHTLDNWERVTKIKGRDSVEQNLTYVAGTGRVYEKSNAYYTTDRFTYDAGGRITLHETFNYATGSGLRTGTARYAYDALGNVVRRWGNAVAPLAAEYSEFGQRTKLWTYRSGSTWTSSTTWPGGTGDLTEWVYQARTGLLLHKKDAALKTCAYEYNLRGQVSRRTEQRGPSDDVVTDYLYYDGAGESSTHASYRTGELKKADYPGATQDVTYTYDRMGRPASVEEQATAGTRTFAYRDTGDLQMAHEDLPGFFGTSRRIARTYEASGAAGRYTGFTYGPSGGGALHNAAYTYHASTGRLDTLGRSGYSSTTYGYLSGSDHVASVATGSWTRSQSWEGGREAVSTLTHSWNGGGARTVAQYTSDYDWRLNRDAVSLTGELATHQGHANGVKVKYWNHLSGDTWDREELRETRTETLDTAVEFTARRRTWTYDVAQNRSQETRTGGWTANAALNAINQLTGLSGSVTDTLTYKDNGNLSQDTGWDYTFDAENRLSRMQQRSGGTLRLEFKYDYLGRRIEKAVFPDAVTQTASKRLRYVYDEWNLIAELDGAAPDTVLRSFTWGLDASETLRGAGGVGGLVRMEEGGVAYYPIYDPSHNVTGLIRDNGSTSTLVASYLYGPFGEKLAADVALGGFVDNNPFRFSTKYTDSETGLVYYGHRYYDPRNGRFLGRDPIGEEGGANLYAFVGNNPVNRWDYLGLTPPDDASTDDSVSAYSGTDGSLNGFFGANFVGDMTGSVPMWDIYRTVVPLEVARSDPRLQTALPGDIVDFDPKTGEVRQIGARSLSGVTGTGHVHIGPVVPYEGAGGEAPAPILPLDLGANSIRPAGAEERALYERIAEIDRRSQRSPVGELYASFGQYERSFEAMTTVANIVATISTPGGSAVEGIAALGGLRLFGANLLRAVLGRGSRAVAPAAESSASRVGRFFYDNRAFRTISREYWDGAAANGRSLHHWLIPQRATWVPQGVRNAGWNTVALPAMRGVFHETLGLNQWMGFARNWGPGAAFQAGLVENSIRLGIPALGVGAGAGGYYLGTEIFNFASGDPTP